MARKITLIPTILLVLGILAGPASAFLGFSSEKPPEKLEYLPERPLGQPDSKAVVAEDVAKGLTFEHETLGAAPGSIRPAVGHWVVGLDGDNRVLVVDGRGWAKGQPSAGLAENARALYGERYAEFLDNVKAYAYYPLSVAKAVEDFREGEISLRFKGIAGRIDQAVGIVFDLQPNGDYLTVRANCLEDNLVLWKLSKGSRSSVKWIRNTPTPSSQWHDLKVVIRGKVVEGYLNGKLYLTHELPQAVSGRVGLWSKADSVCYIDDFKVTMN